MAAGGLSRKPKDRKYPALSHENEGKWNGPFYFIQGADTQFGLQDRWNKVPEEQQSWKEELDRSKLAVQLINGLHPKPRFFVVCGDMIDAFPASKHYDEQLKDFNEVFHELDWDIPLVCVCGNHDVGDQPTVETIAKYRSNFGDDFFSFWVGGVLFVALNSQYYKDGTMVEDLKKEHNLWLDEQLTLAKSAQHVVVFQHIPWFLKGLDEQEEYFNLSIADRKEVIGKLKRAGVKYVFAGHCHKNGGGLDGDLEFVITSAIGFPLGTDKPGMRVVTVQADGIKHSFEDLDNFPTTVNLS